jgi:hypothetical protein
LFSSIANLLLIGAVASLGWEKRRHFSPLIRLRNDDDIIVTANSGRESLIKKGRSRDAVCRRFGQRGPLPLSHGWQLDAVSARGPTSQRCAFAGCAGRGQGLIFTGSPSFHDPTAGHYGLDGISDGRRRGKWLNAQQAGDERGHEG